MSDILEERNHKDVLLSRNRAKWIEDAEIPLPLTVPPISVWTDRRGDKMSVGREEMKVTVEDNRAE
jgi:hypothetical protein